MVKSIFLEDLFSYFVLKLGTPASSNLPISNLIQSVLKKLSSKESTAKEEFFKTENNSTSEVYTAATPEILQRVR